MENGTTHTAPFNTLAGLYGLTSDGQLGVYDQNGQLQIDAQLSAALHDHNLALLQTYLSKKTDNAIFVGLVYPTRVDAHPWKTDTLFLQESIVRHLFPAGDLHSPLTRFQKRNQEHSIYRGFELLLAARNKDGDTSIWCPVLFNAEAMRADYAAALNCEEKSIYTETPALEVLNLFALIPATQRDKPAFRTIVEGIRATMTGTGTRRQNNVFTLIDDVAPQTKVAGPVTFEDVETRRNRAVTLNENDIKQLHSTQHLDTIERWLEIPHRAINPGDLRRFTQFINLNPASLDALARHNLVYTAPEKMVLLDCGMIDRWNMYLLEGTLMLEAKDGQTLIIEGGSAAANAPIAFLKPRKYKVTSVSRVSFMWIHDSLLSALGIARAGAARFGNASVAPNTFDTGHRAAHR